MTLKEKTRSSKSFQTFSCHIVASSPGQKKKDQKHTLHFSADCELENFGCPVDNANDKDKYQVGEVRSMSLCQYLAFLYVFFKLLTN